MEKMKRIIWLIIGIMVLIIAVMMTANAADVYVNDTAIPGWYDATHVKTIQEGINNSTEGQMVFVYNPNQTI